jgi:Acetyl/propionyl-CoA carboxylase, alpha subunit
MKKFNIKIGGTSYAVEITGRDDNLTNLTVNDIPYEIEELTASAPKNVHRTVAPPVAQVTSTQVAYTTAPAATTPVARPVQATASGSGSGLKSPLPGVILELKVKVGDSVKIGQTVLILEAMKMENNIDADKDGIIENINVSVGSSVLEGDVLLTIK